MQKINDQVVSTGDPNGTLTPDEFNKGVNRDQQDVVPQTGQTFDASDKTQLGKAMAAYGAGGDFYTATGTDEIVLSPTGSKVAPDVYVAGQVIRFTPANANTGSVLIEAGGGNIALFLNGAALVGSELSTNYEVVARYDSANNRFNVVDQFINELKATTVRIGFDESIQDGNGIAPSLQVSGTVGKESSILLARYSDDTAGGRVSILKSRATGPGSFVTTEVGDSAGQIVWSIDHELAGVPEITTVTRIQSEVSTTGGGGERGAKLKFRTGGDQATAELRANGDFVSTRSPVGNMGAAGEPWEEYFGNQAAINTSDEALKMNARAFNDDELDVLDGLNGVIFQFIKAVEEKGTETARLHSGLMAGAVEAAFDAAKADGKDVQSGAKYSFFCRDVYQEKELVDVPDDDGSTYEDWRPKFDEDGEPVMVTRLGLRYTELLVAMLMVEKRGRKKLEAAQGLAEARLTTLEAHMEAIEETVNGV